MSNEIKYIDPASTPVAPFMRFKYVAVVDTPVQASLTTALAGANNDLVFTSVDSGTAMNRIDISYTDPSSEGESLAVTVTETAEGEYTNYLIDFSLETSSAVQSALTTSLDGNNNDIVFTAVDAGTDGDNISITYTDPESASQDLAITVTDDAIDISLATDEEGAITTTADEIKAAILAHYKAQYLVTCADADGNDGSGVVTAMSENNLESGDDGGTITTTGDDIKTALLADSDASALVTAADADGNDGSGAVIAMSASSLTGGTDNIVLDMSLIAV